MSIPSGLVSIAETAIRGALVDGDQVKVTKDPFGMNGTKGFEVKVFLRNGKGTGSCWCTNIGESQVHPMDHMTNQCASIWIPDLKPGQTKRSVEFYGVCQRFVTKMEM